MTYTAAKSVAIILASYPQRNVNIADVYVSQLTTQIAEYPPDIAEELCHPSKGIVGSSKFLPTVAEVKQAADQMVSDRRIKAHLLEMEKRKKALPPPAPEPTREERAKVGRLMKGLVASLRA